MRCKPEKQADRWGGRQSGSITVFLTLLFGMMLAVITATFENARVLTSDSYVKAAAEAAVTSAFGGYNRELYQQYGLFGYGGYEGRGVYDLASIIEDTLAKNLLEKPEVSKGIDQLENYTSLYRIQNLAVQTGEAESLTDKEMFYQQIENTLKAQAVSNLTDELTELYQNMAQKGDQKTVEDGLDTTSEYEHGAYEVSPSPELSAEPGSGQGDTVEKENTVEKDSNPLETFRQLIRDGILNLVCDADDLSDRTVETAYIQQAQSREKTDADVADHKSGKTDHSAEEQEGTDDTDSTADLLKSLLRDREGMLSGQLMETSKEKGALICYAQSVFSHYGDAPEKTFLYGMEYLIGGSTQERDNLLQTVNRLLLVRTVLNYAYVRTDAALQASSMATATEIAGALGVPPLISAIQQTILLILSVEESCIDITALLEGKYVPVYKDAASFQMKYSEICIAGKTLFQTKAKNYKTERKGSVRTALCYEEYLWIFLLMVPEKALRLRTYDLIQGDLQRRYQPGFALEQCVAGIEYHVSYEMPFVWKAFLPAGQDGGMIKKQVFGTHYYR